MFTVLNFGFLGLKQNFVEIQKKNFYICVSLNIAKQFMYSKGLGTLDLMRQVLPADC